MNNPILIQSTQPPKSEAPDRPREKLRRGGVQFISDAELLQVIIGSGIRGAAVTQIASEVLELMHSGRQLNLSELTKIKGLNLAKASSVLAAIELGRRLLDKSSVKIIHPRDVLPVVQDITSKRQEHLVLLLLDGANRLVRRELVSIGTLNSALTHPREVFAPAIEARAATVVLVHNHPSGELWPSDADQQMTKRLQQAGQMLGIKLADHIIVGPVPGYCSLKEQGIVVDNLSGGALY